jgi:signal transduction histidine kinase/DNA-binding response OmpR family regulator
LLLASIAAVIASGFFSFVIYRKNEGTFSKQLKQQELMFSLSQSFISTDEPGILIKNALRVSGEFLGVTRMLVGVAEENSAVSDAAYFWCATDEIFTAPKVEGLNDIINNSFPKIQPDIIPTIYCNDTEKDPRYKVMEVVKVKAFVMAPLYVDGKYWAVLSIEECLMPRVWTDSERQLVSTVSNVIAGAVSRDLREKERNAALEQAEKASKAKSDFLANMSHEMRTPMNAIIGMTSIAKLSSDLEKKEYCLGKIEDASNHLLGVINDILDMSKIEANKFDLSPADFSFEKMLQKVVNVINFRVDEKHQNFVVHIDRKIPDWLFGDDQRLAQVITNLLSNAVKFTPEDGSISLDTTLEDEKGDECLIGISVTDSGIGISAEQQSRLFSSFEQADSSTSRKFGGTGLGLAISKRIVEMMGGSIHVESTPGNGSSFIFSVRLKKAAIKKESLFDHSINWGNLRVLAVDDDRGILEYFREIASGKGFFCETAFGGDAALELIEKNGSYDIYFIDWKMPGMDGIELSRRIREKESQRSDMQNSAKAKSVVIMISAAEWSIIEDNAKNAGVDKFLPKPLFPSALVDCVNQCLGTDNLVDTARNSAASPTDEIDNFEGSCILLAEDVDINREIVLSLLEPTLLSIDCAENGRRALEMFTAAPSRYNMIFMDVQMPEMDGYEATRAIRAFENKHVESPESVKRVPIIAMTANVFREDIEKCLAAGMDGHVGKPLDFEDVLSKLREYLVRT